MTYYLDITRVDLDFTYKQARNSLAQKGMYQVIRHSLEFGMIARRYYTYPTNHHVVSSSSGGAEYVAAAAARVAHFSHDQFFHTGELNN